MTETHDESVRARRHDRYLLREGHLFGGLTAVLLSSWHPVLFAVWAVTVASLWCWSLFTEDER